MNIRLSRVKVKALYYVLILNLALSGPQLFYLSMLNKRDMSFSNGQSDSYCLFRSTGVLKNILYSQIRMITSNYFFNYQQLSDPQMLFKASLSLRRKEGVKVVKTNEHTQIYSLICIRSEK